MPAAWRKQGRKKFNSPPTWIMNCAAMQLPNQSQAYFLHVCHKLRMSMKNSPTILKFAREPMMCRQLTWMQMESPTQFWPRQTKLKQTSQRTSAVRKVQLLLMIHSLRLVNLMVLNKFKSSILIQMAAPVSQQLQQYSMVLMIKSKRQESKLKSFNL